MKVFDKTTQTYKEVRIKPGGDTLPIGTIVKYDGDTVPEGYEEVTQGIVTGQEYETGRIIDGKKEYGKRVDCGYINSGNNTIAHGITGITELSGFDAKFKNETNGTIFNIPRAFPTEPEKYNVDCDINLSNITITAGTNFNGSNFKAFVDVYYFKN